MRVHPLPEPGGIPAEIWKKQKFQNINDTYTTPIANYKMRSDMINAKLSTVNGDNVRHLYPHKYLCKDEECYCGGVFGV